VSARGADVGAAEPEGWLDLGGTLRVCSAAETRARVAPLHRRFGITRVARITGLDHIGIPVSVAVRPTSKLLATSQGKGVTAELADVSAVMEAIESWHAENLPPAAVTAAYRALAGPGRALDPARLKRPSPACRSFDPDEAIDWLPVRDLASGREVLAPASYFDLDTARPAPPSALAFRVTTTGLASGNSWTEAVLHGLYEVIERDAHHRLGALQAAEQAARRIDLTSIDCPVNRALIERIERAEVHLEVTDLSSHIPVPAFRACLVDAATSFRTFYDEGMGAHLKAEIALARAITEAAQSRLAYIAGARDDLFPDAYRIEMPRFQRSELASPRGSRAFAACRRPLPGSTPAQHLAAVLAALGADAYALDHTRAELGVPVVHVVCPELHDVVGEER